VVEILGQLEGDQPRFDAMLPAFEYMVDKQLECQERRTEPPRRRIYRSPYQPPQELRTLAEQWERLVLFYAEANAHPSDAGIPSELVHLTACRPATGERFEAVLAPRQPLARSTHLHVELPVETLLAGEGAREGLARFEAFLRPDDVFGVWTSFALDLLWEEGLARRSALNVRLATARALKGKAGGVEEAVPLLGASLPEPWAPGRAGRRIASLDAVVRVLAEWGRATEPPARKPRAA